MEPLTPNQTPKNLFNPDTKDFAFQYADEHDAPQSYTLPSQEITTLPTYLADHAARKLAEHLFWKRELGRTDYQLGIKGILEEIFVDL